MLRWYGSRRGRDCKTTGHRRTRDAMTCGQRGSATVPRCAGEGNTLRSLHADVRAAGGCRRAEAGTNRGHGRFIRTARRMAAHDNRANVGRTKDYDTIGQEFGAGAAGGGDPVVRGIGVRRPDGAIIRAQPGRDRNRRAGSISSSSRVALSPRLWRLCLGTTLRAAGLELRQRIGGDWSGLMGPMPGGSFSGERLSELDVPLA